MPIASGRVWAVVAPKRSWSEAFGNTSAQGAGLNGPLSPSNQYYAFLSSADPDGAGGPYITMFECIPKEWTDNTVLAAAVSVRAKLTIPIPATLFTPIPMTEAQILTAFGITSMDYFAESSWFLITLTTDAESSISGDLCDPNYGLDTTSPDYGTYYLTAAQLVLVPTIVGADTVLVAPPAGAVAASVNVGFGVPAFIARLGAIFSAALGALLAFVYNPPLPPPQPPPPPPQPPQQPQQLVPPPPPPPPPPPFSAVGVMDVGQGGCNMLIGQPAGGGNVVDITTYFDIGFPINRYRSSAPTTLVPANGGVINPNYLGPILQNQTGNLNVVLSHWDWDHWKLGQIANLQNLTWTVPAVPIGGAAAAFFGLIPNANVNVWAGPGVLQVNGYELHRCVPAAGMTAPVIKNNNGIAMIVELCVPIADPNPHRFVMTADANFTSVPGLGPNPPNISVLAAVHHGTVLNGATVQIPPPVAPYQATGRLVYSYGINDDLEHCYGFPFAAAVTNYTNAGYTVQVSTAEGVNINGQPTTRANRGNVRVGNQAYQLNVAYANTAFAAFPNTLT